LQRALPDSGVSGRIPHRAVDAVEDSRDVAAAAADHAVEAATELMRGDLVGIGRADGGDATGVLQSGFHERQLTVEFEPVRMHHSCRQAELRKVAVRKQALVGQVVHREHRSGRGRRMRIDPRARHRGMPVVGVQHLRRPLGVELARCQMGADPAEQREALQVVAPFAAVAGLVRAAGAAVQVGRIDDVGRHMAVRQTPEAQRDAPGAEQRPELVHGGLVQHRIGDRRQAGQQQARLGAGFDQRLRQRAHHVGQAAGLDQRKDLRGDMQHLHAGASFIVSSLASISRVTSVMPCSVR
jgi:hypothetical protein